MARIQNKWLAEAPAETIKGNDQASAGIVKDLTVSQVLAMLGISGSSDNLQAIPVVETPAVYQVHIESAVDYPEIVCEYDESGDLDIVATLEVI